MDNTAAGIERFYREEFGRILATLIRVLGDFDLAEDAAQDAFASAVEQWHRDGLPDNPRAWIVGVARHKAIERQVAQIRHALLPNHQNKSPKKASPNCHPAFARKQPSAKNNGADSNVRATGIALIAQTRLVWRRHQRRRRHHSFRFQQR